MLTDLRRTFPWGMVRPLGVGSAEVGAGVGGGRCVVDGARSPLRTVLVTLRGVAIPPVLLRVLVTGKAGSAAVGGPIDGRDDGFGKVVAMFLS